MKPTEAMELNEKVARLNLNVQLQRSGKDPRLQTESARLALAMGYLFDPMHGPLVSFWIHAQTAERHTNDWFENHFSDLNACAEFEKGLEGKKRYAYLGNLSTLVGYNKDIPFFDQKGSFTSGFGDFVWAITTATAEQRCRAFIAVMEEQNAE